MRTENQYAERDAMWLDQQGGHYIRHIDHMTREELHSKSDIAAELGWRDYQIAELARQVSALQASQDNIINGLGIKGDGLPPVGCIVECFTGNNWHQCKVVLTGEPGSKTEALVYNVKTTRPFWADEFRPIRSAEDVARGAVGLAVYHAVNWNAEGELASPSRIEDYKKVYDAIAAGKIPGVRLE